VPSAILLSVTMPSVNLPNVMKTSVALSFKEKMKLKKTSFRILCVSLRYDVTALFMTVGVLTLGIMSLDKMTIGTCVNIGLKTK